MPCPGELALFETGTEMQTLSGFYNFSALDTASANFDALAGAVDQRAHALQIRIEAAARPVICVGNIVAELRAFAAKFTTISHNYLQSSPQSVGWLA